MKLTHIRQVSAVAIQTRVPFLPSNSLAGANTRSTQSSNVAGSIHSQFPLFIFRSIVFALAPSRC